MVSHILDHPVLVIIGLDKTYFEFVSILIVLTGHLKD